MVRKNVLRVKFFVKNFSVGQLVVLVTLEWNGPGFESFDRKMIFYGQEKCFKGKIFRKNFFRWVSW